MNKHIILMTLIFATGTFASCFSSKNNEQKHDLKNKQDLKNNRHQAVILDGGVKRTIYLAKDSQSKNHMNAYSAKQLNSKEGVIVSFKNSSHLPIGNFAKKYGLKFKQKMVIGYYIFDNISNLSDLQIVEKIITNETNVKTVKPNWRIKADLH